MARLLCALALLIVSSSAAHAGIITINPNAYPLGTDLSTMFDGARLAVVSQNGGSTFAPIASPALVSPAWAAASGVNGIGGVLWQGNGYEGCRTQLIFSCRDDYRLLEVTFDRPTDYIRVVTSYYSDAAEMYLYDVAGHLIDHPSTEVSHARDSDATIGVNVIQRDHADIYRMIFGGFENSVSATELQYHKVAEPSTFLLLAIGGVVFARRKR